MQNLHNTLTDTNSMQALRSKYIDLFVNVQRIEQADRQGSFLEGHGQEPTSKNRALALSLLIFWLYAASNCRSLQRVYQKTKEFL
jgi:hypothetical protein